MNINKQIGGILIAKDVNKKSAKKTLPYFLILKKLKNTWIFNLQHFYDCSPNKNRKKYIQLFYLLMLILKVKLMYLFNSKLYLLYMKKLNMSYFNITKWKFMTRWMIVLAVLDLKIVEHLKQIFVFFWMKIFWKCKKIRIVC